MTAKINPEKYNDCKDGVLESLFSAFIFGGFAAITLGLAVTGDAEDSGSPQWVPWVLFGLLTIAVIWLLLRAYYYRIRMIDIKSGEEASATEQ